MVSATAPVAGWDSCYKGKKPVPTFALVTTTHSMVGGDTMGSVVVGEIDRDVVGSEAVGETDGDMVGTESTLGLGGTAQKVSEPGTGSPS